MTLATECTLPLVGQQASFDGGVGLRFVDGDRWKSSRVYRGAIGEKSWRQVSRAEAASRRIERGVLESDGALLAFRTDTAGELDRDVWAEFASPDGILGVADACTDGFGEVLAVGLGQKCDPRAGLDNKLDAIGAGAARGESEAIECEFAGKALEECIEAEVESGEFFELSSLDLGHDSPDFGIDIEGLVESEDLLDLHEPEAVDSGVTTMEVVGGLLGGKLEHAGNVTGHKEAGNRTGGPREARSARISNCQ